jgi:hypothetical protein
MSHYIPHYGWSYTPTVWLALYDALYLLYPPCSLVGHPFLVESLVESPESPSQSIKVKSDTLSIRLIP